MELAFLWRLLIHFKLMQRHRESMPSKSECTVPLIVITTERQRLNVVLFFIVLVGGAQTAVDSSASMEMHLCSINVFAMP